MQQILCWQSFFLVRWVPTCVTESLDCTMLSPREKDMIPLWKMTTRKRLTTSSMLPCSPTAMPSNTWWHTNKVDYSPWHTSTPLNTCQITCLYTPDWKCKWGGLLDLKHLNTTYESDYSTSHNWQYKHPDTFNHHLDWHLPKKGRHSARNTSTGNIHKAITSTDTPHHL